MIRQRFMRTIFCLLVLTIVLCQAACIATLTQPNAPPVSSPVQENAKTTDAVSAPSENETNPPEVVLTNYVKPDNYDYSGSISFGGGKRNYYIHIPESYDGSRPVPLVLVLPQYMGYPEAMAKLTGFNKVADEHGFIVLYPAYIGTMWNIGLVEADRNIDDVGFIASLIDNISRDFNIDSKMIYSTGLSAGAAMSQVLACQLSDRIAAVALVAGSFIQSTTDSCQSQTAKPVLIIHGTTDPICRFSGGTVNVNGESDRLLPIRSLVDFWVAHNNCSTAPIKTDLPDPGTNDGTKVHVEDYRGASDDSEMIFYIVEGGGHTWPGGQQYFSEQYIGKTSKVFNASDTIWQFFSSHPMK